MIMAVIRFLAFVRLWNRITCAAAYCTECLILVCFGRNQCHVIRTDIMFFVRQTIAVIEMRIHTSEFLCPLVHQINKCTVITTKFFAYMLRECISTFICRFKHDRINTLLYGQLFPKISGNMRCISLIFEYGILRKGYLFVHITIFYGKQCRHNLCNTRRKTLSMTLFLI